MQVSYKEHMRIREQQRSVTEHTMHPSRVVSTYWHFATDVRTQYPKHTEHGGKWLLFVDFDELDICWKKCYDALFAGKLGSQIKCTTAKSYNPQSGKAVICVYTYDHKDEEDVMRIRGALRDLGFDEKMPYKTDWATRKGQYGKGSSKFFA